ncbi:hypothetical protein ON010_g6622 [Phytophthora cinnamomi]|nr:hypothetical protein ON010_g6622 [Phytophthora cinnamomi]
MNWEDANILTLGYREVTPGAAGHRVTQSNAIMCYYPNTLVAALKKPLWESLHQLMGDDLMTHLLLNYTIIVQLKGAPGSYMQLTGKSLRQQKQGISEACAGKAKREVSINLVMYARHFRKDRVFASSHVLVKASKTGDPISRTESSRVLGSIFPDAVGQKRLPKRLINLIPMIQSMVSRFKACKVEELAGKLIPVHSEFRKFMAENPNIKSKIAEKAAEARYSSQPILPPIVRKALDDGYLSQNEAVVGPSDERKRKRREEAIEMLSHVSVGSLKHGHDKTTHPVKKQKTADDANLTKRSTYGISDLTKLQQHKEDIKRVLTFSAPKKKIYRLVRKFVAAVVPKDIWGGRATKKNWKCVKTMLRKLIYSRKFDIFSLKKCADEFQVTNVKWMDVQPGIKFCPPNERAKRHELFKNLLCWILSSLVFPLLRNLFYITESEGKANEIVFYQRPVWNVISTLALDDLEGAILQSSSEKALPNDHERQLSTSRLRLLPKTSGIRPLMNLSTAVEEDKVSRLLGASVRNIDEIYKRLKPLFREISSCPRCEDRRRASGDTPMAYCVSVDVERCFDTIRPRKLYQMLKKAIQEDEYLIRKHWVGHQVAPTSADSDESLPFFFKLERPACPSGELLGFDDLAGRSVKRNSMFVDGVIYDYLTKTKALQLLKEHLSANVVQIDGHDYVQRCGIPQGSVLSTTLCNLYYAHFERRVLRKRLPEVCDPAVVAVSCCQHEELCRYTDDFMYITTDLKRAQRFFDVMHEGNEEYGCFVNIDKSQANFNAADGEQHASVSSAQESDGCISWCGMLIDANNLQLYVNYEKYDPRQPVPDARRGSAPIHDSRRDDAFRKPRHALLSRMYPPNPKENEQGHPPQPGTWLGVRDQGICGRSIATDKNIRTCAGVDDRFPCVPTYDPSQARASQGVQKYLWTTEMSLADAVGRASNGAGKIHAASDENSRYRHCWSRVADARPPQRIGVEAVPAPRTEVNCRVAQAKTSALIDAFVVVPGLQRIVEVFVAQLCTLPLVHCWAETLHTLQRGEDLPVLPAIRRRSGERKLHERYGGARCWLVTALHIVSG